MLFTGSIGVLLLLSIAVSSFVPSDETLRLAFDRGQRFYVIEDYVQAIEKFAVVKGLQDSRLVDETRVLIRVGEVDFPVRVAATFQLANSYRNLAAVQLAEAQSQADSATAAQLTELARAHFAQAATYYSESASSTELPEIQVLSQYQLLKTFFQAGEYARVIDAGVVLRERYPDSDYVDEALYEVGWAYYNLKQYEQAIEAFSQVSRLGSADYRVDRAQFQIGRSYYELKRYAEARQALRQLLGRQDVGHLAESQRARMQADKLSGVVKETALELGAKAQLLVGDSYAAEGQVAAAVAAYQQVISGYASERELAEEAYVKIGQVYFAQGDPEPGLLLYRRAIGEVQDPGFRARMQARIARQYYAAGNFAQALSEYELFIKAYGDVRQSGVLPLDHAAFQRAQCLFELAEGQRQAGEQVASLEHYRRSVEAYLQVIADYPGTSLRGESLLGAGLAAQRRGESADRKRALELLCRVRDEYPAQSDIGARARLQVARFHYAEREFAEAASLYAAYLELYPDAADRQRVLLELGLASRDAEQLDQALAALQQIPTEGDIGSKAALVEGEILLRLGRLDEAAAAMEQGLAALPAGESAGELNYVLGKVRFEQKAYPEAAAAFSRAREQSASEAVLQGSLLGRGSALYQAADYERAAADLEALLAADPAADLKDQTRRLLGQIYVKMGRRAEAIAAYQAVIGSTQDPRERVEFTLLLAELYYGLARYEEAIEQTRAVIDGLPGEQGAAEGGALRDRAYFVMGNAYVSLENPAEAHQVFVKALEVSPRSALRQDLLYGRAAAAFALEKYEEVVAVLDEFVAKGHDSGNLESAHYYLSYAYLRMGDLKEAVVWFGRLAERFPASAVAAEALFQQGECLFNLSKFVEAAGSFEALLSRYPTAELADNALYNLAWCYFELKRPDDAVVQFERLATRYPGSRFAASALFSLGDHYFNLNVFDKAKAAYQKVVDQYPGSEVVPQAQRVLAEIREIEAYPRYEEAMALFDKEEYPQAVAALTKVIADYPGTEIWAGAMANLGMCYEYLNKWKEAAKVYQELLEYFGEGSEANSVAAFAKEHLDWLKAYRL